MSGRLQRVDGLEDQRPWRRRCAGGRCRRRSRARRRGRAPARDRRSTPLGLEGRRDVVVEDRAALGVEVEPGLRHVALDPEELGGRPVGGQRHREPDDAQHERGRHGQRDRRRRAAARGAGLARRARAGPPARAAPPARAMTKPTKGAPPRATRRPKGESAWPKASLSPREAAVGRAGAAGPSVHDPDERERRGGRHAGRRGTSQPYERAGDRRRTAPPGSPGRSRAGRRRRCPTSYSVGTKKTRPPARPEQEAAAGARPDQRPRRAGPARPGRRPRRRTSGTRSRAGRRRRGTAEEAPHGVHRMPCGRDAAVRARRRPRGPSWPRPAGRGPRPRTRRASGLPRPTTRTSNSISRLRRADPDQLGLDLDDVAGPHRRPELHVGVRREQPLVAVGADAHLGGDVAERGQRVGAVDEVARRSGRGCRARSGGG